MSVSNIPESIKLQLWGRAAGRCQYSGCNRPLYRDQLTQAEFNSSYIAHIVADRPNGPRGDAILSPKLEKDLANLMLLCDVHHRLVDIANVAGHPVELLRHMKSEHEDRIERVTNIAKSQQTHIMLFGANIGLSKFGLNYEEAVTALLPGWYPAESRAITVGLGNSSFEDHGSEFWKIEAANLRHNFDRMIQQRLGNGEIKHISVFGLAPQPLLMLLGSLLGDFIPAEVYARHRAPPGWKWPQDGKSVDFLVSPPDSFEGNPVLIIGLSADVHPDRIRAVLGDMINIWTLTIEHPFNDFLQCHSDVAKFREACQRTLNEIKLRHGQNSVLHVFPAMPAALALEFGRCLMPKAEIRMRIYDQNWRTQGFSHALDLPAL